jgi:hypothetical protein
MPYGGTLTRHFHSMALMCVVTTVLSLPYLTASLQNIVNLAEQHGKEGAVTTAYREYVNEMKNKDVV